MLKGFVSGEEKDIKRIPMKGVNILENTLTSGTRAGVTYTVNPDKSITLNGTITGTVAHNITIGYINAKQGITYTISGVNGFTATTLQIFTESSVAFTYGNRLQCYDGAVTRTAAGDQRCEVRLYLYPNQTYDTVTIYPQIVIGSTPLPYEPYGYQEGWEVRDNQDRLIWGREDELQTATGTLPFKGYALPVKVKSLLGNAVQNGTPAPDNIITPEMCGVRTGNLVDATMYGKLDESVVYLSMLVTIPIVTLTSPEGLFTRVVWTKSTDTTERIHVSNWIASENSSTFDLASYSDANCFKIEFRNVAYSNLTDEDIALRFNIMINAGTEPLPYEPYGYKLPLTNAGQTRPVYLGEVSTVRRVKKLVLDGTENWVRDAADQAPNVLFYIRASDSKTGSAPICTHYKGSVTTTWSTVPLYSVTHSIVSGGIPRLVINTGTDFSDATEFSAYLAAQYAAGHPVTIWYVLAAEQTGIVNEPLCKISTYADELTTIQVHGLSAPLYGIGDYKDTLNLSTGVVTRKVKKLVLTGSESVMIYNDLGYVFIDDGKDETIAPFCDILPGVTTPSGESPNSVKQLGVNVTGGRRAAILFKVDNLFTNDTVFKTWLSQNTPTIWYVLSTPTTETVTVPTGMTGEIEGYLTQVSTPSPTNRSVPKWNGVEETGGTYAVTVYTPPEIPTTTGENTLTVDTTLAPSNLTVKGHIKELT